MQQPEVIEDALRRAPVASFRRDERLYGPDDPSCSGTPAFTATGRSIDASGTATSGPFTPTLPGTYHWVASYSGNDANEPSTGTCGTTTVTITEPADTATTAPITSTAPPAANPPVPGPAPVAPSCRSLRSLTIHLLLAAPRDIKLRPTVIRVNGKVKKILGRGVTSFPLALNGYPSGVVQVRQGCPGPPEGCQNGVRLPSRR